MLIGVFFAQFSAQTSDAILAILPVIDLKDGVVVRAVRGDRQQYRPIQSSISKDATASSVAEGLIEHFGFDSVYVADLDAIAGREPNWQALRQISECELRVWIDMGVGNLERIKQLNQFAADHKPFGAIIVALESVSDPDAMRSLAATIGDLRHFVFSLDLRDGEPLNDSRFWQTMSPLEIAGLAMGIGFQRVIVLDLAAVGADEGPQVEEICRQIRAAHPACQLTSGGGVRDANDVRRFESAGCDYVLVASALHDGRIKTVGS